MKRNNKQKGVTLIEAIISVALLSILIIPISGIITTSLTTSKKAENKQKAAYLGQQLLEEINIYDEITLNSGQFTLLDGYKMKREIINNNDKFKSDNNIITEDFEDLDINGFDVEVVIERDSNFSYVETEANSTLQGKNIDFKFNLLNRIIKYNSLSSNIISNNLILIISGSDVIKFEICDEINPTNVLFSGEKAKEDNNILFYLEDLFTEEGLAIKVENKRSDDINIFVQKGPKSTGKVIVRSKEGIIKIYNNIVEENVKKTGDLYNISVKVKKGSDILFEGSANKNLNIK